MKTQWKVTLSLVLAALLLTVATVAWAAEPPGRGVLHGTLTAIDGYTLTIATPRGEQKVVTDEQTRFRIKGVENPTLADLEVSDYILAGGHRDEEGNLVARVVAVVPPERLQRLVLRGEVLAVEGDTLTVKTPRQGEVSVNTDENTRFRVPGVENPTIADVSAGDYVLVRGSLGEDGTFTARGVAVVDVEKLRQHAVRGTVTAIEGTTLTVTTPQGETVQVLTDDQTRFRVPGVENPTLADVEVGNAIIAAGQRGDDDAFTARVVAVVPRRPLRRHLLRGQVTAVGDSQLTLARLDGQEVTVLITDDTRFRIPGVEEPGLDDVEPGDRAGVFGQPDESGQIVAKLVIVLKGPPAEDGKAIPGQ